MPILPFVYAITSSSSSGLSLQTPFEILGQRTDYSIYTDFNNGMGIGFIWHALVVAFSIFAIIQIMIGIFQMQYLRMPMEILKIKAKIRSALLCLLVMGLLPTLADTVLAIIYTTVSPGGTF